MRMNAKMKFLSRILCLGLVAIMTLAILCACNKDDDFRNPQNGEPTQGEFYDLQTAYDNGWLSKNDLRNIAYHYADDAQKKGFKPTPKNPDMLSEETALAIKESYIKSYKESRPESNANDVPIDGYYGTYNGLVAVYIRYGGAWCVVTEKNVGGIEFVFPDSHEILVWKSYDKDNDAVVQNETFYTPYAGRTEVYGNMTIQFPDYNDMFDDSCVMVVMSEKGISAINKKYELSYFGNCQLESIEDLTYITGDINDKPYLNKEGFQQILKLNLLNKSKQSVVDTLYELRTVSGIQWAGPNYYHTIDC